MLMRGSGTTGTGGPSVPDPEVVDGATRCIGVLVKRILPYRRRPAVVVAVTVIGGTLAGLLVAQVGSVGNHTLRKPVASPAPVSSVPPSASPAVVEPPMAGRDTLPGDRAAGVPARSPGGPGPSPSTAAPAEGVAGDPAEGVAPTGRPPAGGGAREPITNIDTPSQTTTVLVRGYDYAPDEEISVYVGEDLCRDTRTDVGGSFQALITDCVAAAGERIVHVTVKQDGRIVGSATRDIGDLLADILVEVADVIGIS